MSLDLNQYLSTDKNETYVKKENKINTKEEKHLIMKNREEAITKMKRALDEFIIEGIKTTIPFHRKLMDDPAYNSGVYTTKFMEDFSVED